MPLAALLPLFPTPLSLSRVSTRPSLVPGGWTDERRRGEVRRYRRLSAKCGRCRAEVGVRVLAFGRGWIFIWMIMGHPSRVPILPNSFLVVRRGAPWPKTRLRVTCARMALKPLLLMGAITGAGLSLDLTVLRQVMIPPLAVDRPVATVVWMLPPVGMLCLAFTTALVLAEPVRKLTSPVVVVVPPDCEDVDYSTDVPH